MIREPKQCAKGHTYTVIKPSNYHGSAVYPPDCPKCRHT